MKDIKDVCVIVQARLSSKRTPGKMTRPFAGTTITDICVEKILNSKIIPKENFYLSVYEEELLEIGRKHGVNIYHRSKESAEADNPKLTELYEWWDKLPFKYAILVSACCPLIKIETIDNFVEQYINSDSDGMFGVIQKKNYFWNDEEECLTPLTEDCMNTRTTKVINEAAHCLYAARLDKVGKGIWMGDFRKKGDIKLTPVPEEEVFDIDYEWQFDLCEAMYKFLNEKKE